MRTSLSMFVHFVAKENISRTKEILLKTNAQYIKLYAFWYSVRFNSKSNFPLIYYCIEQSKKRSQTVITVSLEKKSAMIGMESRFRELRFHFHLASCAKKFHRVILAIHSNSQTNKQKL